MYVGGIGGYYNFRYPGFYGSSNKSNANALYSDMASAKTEQERKDILNSWLEESERNRENEKKVFQFTSDYKKDGYLFGGISGSNMFSVRTSKPKSNPGMLTARLLMSESVFEVNSVVAEANSDLVQYYLVAATTSGAEASQARAAISKLEKLIGRATKKIRELDKEDIMMRTKKKAEENRKQKLAEQIKNELKKRRIARTAKESSYLLDANKADPNYDDKNLSMGFADFNNGFAYLSEAQIQAVAEAIAVAEIAAAESAGVEVSVDSGGGEAAVSGGGEGASLDISV